MTDVEKLIEILRKYDTHYIDNDGMPIKINRVDIVFTDPYGTEYQILFEEHFNLDL